MDLINFIKDYQALVGSFIGIISSIAVWFLFKFFEKKEIEKDSKKEIISIFAISLRECEDSMRDLISFAQELEKNVKSENGSFDIILPSKFNKIPVNENVLANLSKHLHPLICEQINIANSAAKLFNNRLLQYEEMPVFIFNANIKILQTGIETKEKVIIDYYKDLDIYAKGIITSLNNDSEKIRQHLLRPVVVMRDKERNLEKLFLSNKLDDYLDEKAKAILSINDKLKEGGTAFSGRP